MEAVEVAADLVEVEVLAVVELAEGLVGVSGTARSSFSHGGLAVTGGLVVKGETKL